MNEANPFLVLDLDLDHFGEMNFFHVQNGQVWGPGCPLFELH